MIEGSPLRLNISSIVYSTPLKNAKRTLNLSSPFQSERKKIFNEKITPDFSQYMSPKLSSLFKEIEPDSKFPSYTYSGNKKYGIPHGHGFLLTPSNTIIYVGEFYLGKFWGEGILKNPQPYIEESETAKNLENIEIENNFKEIKEIERTSTSFFQNDQISERVEIEENRRVEKDKINQDHYLNNSFEKSAQNNEIKLVNGEKLQANQNVIHDKIKNDLFSIIQENCMITETKKIDQSKIVKPEKSQKIQKKLITENDENYFETMNGKKIMKSWLEYEGHFIDGCFSGRGLVRLTNGDTFCGGFLKGEIDGWGIYLKKEGDRFIGEWRRGKLREIL